MEKSVFLSARWENLLLLTYSVPAELLAKRLPAGIEPDLLNGRAFVSLVAFDFLETRLKGFKIPFHTNFPEINLRFYVKRNGKRGVMFVKELVPKYFIALTARLIYNEPYEAVPMRSEIAAGRDEIRMEHAFDYAGKTYRIAAKAENRPFVPAEDSAAHFFKEHDIGYGVLRNGRAVKYTVEHPVWEVYPLKNYETDLDFGAVYGSEWAFLNEQKPDYAAWAKGSEIKVFPAEPFDNE